MSNVWGFLGLFACAGAVIAFMFLKGKAWKQLADDLTKKDTENQ